MVVHLLFVMCHPKKKILKKIALFGYLGVNIPTEGLCLLFSLYYYLEKHLYYPEFGGGVYILLKNELIIF